MRCGLNKAHIFIYENDAVPLASPAALSAWRGRTKRKVIVILKPTWIGVSVGLLIGAASPSLTAQTNGPSQTNSPVAAHGEIRTPKAAATPRLNGPSVFGVRPGHPVVYH